MQKAYSRIRWENEPSQETPLNDANLNRMDSAIDEVDNRILTLDITKANKTEISEFFTGITFDESTGVLTFTRKNGSTIRIDTKLEKLAVNFSYDAENERLVITLDDGSVQYVDMKALITQYEFTESDTIILSVDSSGKVKATIKKGSITGDMLEPNYLANVTVQAESANASAVSASASAESAKSDADRAEDAADRAVAVAGFTVDTSLNENSPNPVTNKATTKGIMQAGESGARNLIPFPYYEKAGTENGITWTVNDDGTIGVSGTATANVSFTIRATAQNWTVKKGTYTLSGCPSGGSFSGYRLQLARFIDGTLTSYANDYGNGVTFEITDDFPLLMQFVVASGVTIDATVEPMLERGGVKHSFVPYYFGTAEKAKTAETLGDYLPSDFATKNGANTFAYDGYTDFKVKRKVDTESAGVGIVFANNKSSVGMIGFKNRKFVRTDVSTWAEYEVFDTSNKPSGTYNGVTNEGLASSIQIGEAGKTIGNLLYIETEDGFGLICATGGAYFGPQSGNKYQHFHDTDICYVDGILEIMPGEASSIFNRSGVVYKYSLL